MIPKHKIIIEYDGRQHFNPVGYFGGVNTFNETVEKDNIKNLWAKNNGYRMVRISYKNKANIDSILLDIFSKYEELLKGNKHD
jgi:very-short-patch-repair endonuclease